MSRILIADDDTHITSSCINFFTKEKDFEIIGIAHTGQDAINSYITQKPDVLILDLNIPNLDGIEVINYLAKLDGERIKNNIIVISGYLNELMPYNTSKVYKIFPKPFDYNELINVIYEIQGVLDRQVLENAIDDLFIKLGLFIYANKGLDYFKEAIILCYYDKSWYKNLTVVYEKIANQDFTKKLKSKNVLWSIESMVNNYRKKINLEVLNSNFKYYFDSQRTLTPKYLIELIIIQLKHIIK